MLCGGHVGRSHGNNLKEYKSKKVLDKGFIDQHKKKHLEIGLVKCVCEGKSYCGCLTDDFIVAAKRNHFSALKQSGKCPEEYARRMRVLGKYHCRDIHKWEEDGNEKECGFHVQVVCSCGKCGKEGKEKEEILRSVVVMLVMLDKGLLQVMLVKVVVISEEFDKGNDDKDSENSSDDELTDSDDSSSDSSSWSEVEDELKCKGKPYSTWLF